jgi:hypothetical protein
MTIEAMQQWADEALARKAMCRLPEWVTNIGVPINE